MLTVAVAEEADEDVPMTELTSGGDVAKPCAAVWSNTDVVVSDDRVAGCECTESDNGGQCEPERGLSLGPCLCTVPSFICN